jgi:hypothetical protein
MAFIMTLPSRPIFGRQNLIVRNFEEQSNPSRDATFVIALPSAKLPCGRKALPVDDIRSCVSTGICHSFGAGV